MSSRRSVLRFFGGALLSSAVVVPRVASAAGEPLPAPARAAPSQDLLARLAVHAAHFETMRTHASFAVEGRLDGVDGDGKTDSVKEMKARVDADGKTVVFKILKYVEDGEDKTAEAQQKQRDRKKDAKRPEIRMPFHMLEQPRYVFDQIAVDPTRPTLVRIGFVPKVPAENTIQGSAWVDTVTGTVLSAELKLSKTPMFVDYVLFSVEFGAQTSLGPAISRATMEGKGGFLFVQKRFRGVATLSQHRIA